MLSLAALLDERRILLDMEAKRKKHVITALVDVIADAGMVDDPKLIAQYVLEREKRASTGIGRGVAIPHWLGEEISETVMAFGRTKTSVAFDAIDGMPVRLFFLMLGPAGRPTEHLQLLSRLSRILHNDRCVDRLLNAADPHQIRLILEEEESE